MFGVTDSSDTRIIRQVLAGKREAFGALVDRYLAQVHAVAYSRVRNRPDAEDVAQETFLPRASRTPATPVRNALSSLMCARGPRS
ncbi:MAG: hypothetical protein HZB26_04480 [Candidatus Hydrogenedentes bacterium]|nr:hypothetical protein [Candidatus Hydrogenedentota bacterium]